MLLSTDALFPLSTVTCHLTVLSFLSLFHTVSVVVVVVVVVVVGGGGGVHVWVCVRERECVCGKGARG